MSRANLIPPAERIRRPLRDEAQKVARVSNTNSKLYSNDEMLHLLRICRCTPSINIIMIIRLTNHPKKNRSNPSSSLVEDMNI